MPLFVEPLAAQLTIISVSVWESGLTSLLSVPLIEFILHLALLIDLCHIVNHLVYPRILLLMLDRTQLFHLFKVLLDLLLLYLNLMLLVINFLGPVFLDLSNIFMHQLLRMVTCRLVQEEHALASLLSSEEFFVSAGWDELVVLKSLHGRINVLGASISNARAINGGG